MQMGSITTTGHSLGGALAALCAHDIADCLNREASKDEHSLQRRLQRFGSAGASLTKSAKFAIQATQNVAGKAALSDQAHDVYVRTEEAIKAFSCAMKVRRGDNPMPPVTAVTFAAPRVGDKNFAAKFGTPRCTSYSPTLFSVPKLS